MILQANIIGYAGTPATVIGYLDLDEQQLIIQAVSKIRNMRYENKESGESAGFVSNVPTDDFDLFFDERDFAKAFKSYRTFDGAKTLFFEQSTQRATPRIEINAISDNGSSYLISSETTNEQIAVIAMCYFAQQAIESEKVNDMYDELGEFFSVM